MITKISTFLDWAVKRQECCCKKEISICMLYAFKKSLGVRRLLRGLCDEMPVSKSEYAKFRLTKRKCKLGSNTPKAVAKFTRLAKRRVLFPVSV
jgi:hypothetical protein